MQDQCIGCKYDYWESDTNYRQCLKNMDPKYYESREECPKFSLAIPDWRNEYGPE